MVDEQQPPDDGARPDGAPGEPPAGGAAGPDDPTAGGPVGLAAGEPGEAPPAAPVAAPVAASAPGRAGAWRARRRVKKALRSKLRRRLTRSGIALGLAVVAVAGTISGYSLYRLHQIHRIAARNLTPPSATGGIEDILLIGSTNRCAVKGLANFVQQCKQGVTGINSDVVMIVRLDPRTHRITLLSIPRDTFVPDARAGGLYNKIDAALADGPNQLAEAISQDFGIPINHFVELNFGTFANVVSALGGIQMYFPDRLFDANSDLNVTRTGCLHLNGVQALELVRSRHLYYFTKGEKVNYAAIRAAGLAGTYYTPSSGGHYDGSGDLGRITRVHLFVKALATEVAKRGLGNPITDNAIIGAIAPDLTVDSTLGNSEMLHLILDFRHANFGAVPELTAPIVVNAVTYYYKGYNYGDVVFPTEPQDQQTIDEFMGTAPPGLKLHPASISVSVIDGTDSPTATAAVAARLHAIGYPVIPTTASRYVGPISETTVLYAKGHLQQAERVMASLSGTVVLGQGTPAGGADVSVVAGSDLAVRSGSATTRKPSTTSSTAVTTTTSATASSAATTTTLPATSAAPTTTAPVPSVTTTTNPNFSAPTSSSPAVPSYDPRACSTG